MAAIGAIAVWRISCNERLDPIDRERGLFQLEAIIMDQASHSEITGSVQLQALIADLNWRVQLLNYDIAEEAQLSPNVDAASAFYSTPMEHLRSRRDNLVKTIAMLERQLDASDLLARVA
jgi:hypothetical protein